MSTVPARSVRRILAVCLAGLLGGGLAGARASGTDLTSVPADAAPPDTTDRLESEWLDETAGLVASLLEGSLPPDFVVQSLFEVDLLDESAVARRREQLHAAILERRALIGAADSIATPEIVDSAVTGDSTIVAGEASAAADSLPDPVFFERRIRLDELRLAFLRLSAEKRQEINETERRRRKLLMEREDAQREREAAEARAREAERRRRLALEGARRERTVRAEQLANELARAETFNTDLARFDAALATAREAEVERANAELQEMLELQRRLESTDRGAREALAVHGSALARLAEVRPRLRSALETWFSVSSLPRFAPALDLKTFAGDTANAEARDQIDRLYAEIAASHARLVDAERETRWQAVEYRSDRLRRTNELRIRAIEKLPAAKRGQVLGITRTGLQNLVAEIDQLELRARLWVASRLRVTDTVPGRLRDLFTLGTATYILLRSLSILLLLILFHRRGGRLYEAASQGLLENARDPHVARRTRASLRRMRTFAPQAYFLLAVWILHRAIGDAARWPEVSTAFTIAYWIAGYRIVSRLVLGIVVSLARRHALGLDGARTVRLARALRTVLRVVAGMGIFLDLSERVLGRGFLYHVSVQGAWALAIGGVFYVLHGWRGSIAEAYVQVRPGGRLAALVLHTRHRWYGFLVGGAAFLWLAGRWAAVIARDFALGFDQVRKGLAYLFRRRIEKHAESQGYADGRLEMLPRPLVRALTECAIEEPSLRIDHFPGMDRFESAFGDWCAQGTRGTFLLTGERGMGKTSWLREVTTDVVPVTRVALGERVHRARELWPVLVGSLGLDADPDGGRDAVETALTSDEPRLIVLDGCQNLFLGTVGGYEAFEAFSELAEATRTHVFWLCAANANAWAHLESVRPDLALFPHRHGLEAWSETLVYRLIETRTQASGIRASFEDLLIEPVGRSVQNERLSQTQDGYVRLLWDYSDGNPRVALHFWLRSLVPAEDGSAHVRLFKTPSPIDLESISETARFILASIVLHENLTVEETSAATRFSTGVCGSHMDRLEEDEILELEGSRYRLSTHWHRAVIRHLRRKNMLAN